MQINGNLSVTPIIGLSDRDHLSIRNNTVYAIPQTDPSVRGLSLVTTTFTLMAEGNKNVVIMNKIITSG